MDSNENSYEYASCIIIDEERLRRDYADLARLVGFSKDFVVRYPNAWRDACDDVYSILAASDVEEGFVDAFVDNLYEYLIEMRETCLERASAVCSLIRYLGLDMIFYKEEEEDGNDDE